MPLSKYDNQFGGKKGSAQKAYNAMIQRYGSKRGQEVFYATKNKRKKSPTHQAIKRRINGKESG